MSIDDLINKWHEDSKIDRTDISQEIIKISDLTFQWQRLLMEENLRLKSIQDEYNKIYLEKYRLYTEGVKNTKDRSLIEKLPKGAILKSEVEMYLQADDEIIKISTKVAVSKEKIEFIKAAIWELRGRGKNLQNYVQWEKFMNGN